MTGKNDTPGEPRGVATPPQALAAHPRGGMGVAGDVAVFDAFLLDSTSQGSPGIDHVKWKKPVLAGDRLTGTLTVLAKRQSKSRPQLGLVIMRSELFNQRGESVFELENSVMFLTRDAAGSRA